MPGAIVIVDGTLRKRLDDGGGGVGLERELRAVEPYFEELADRGPLVYTYGNRDKERPTGGDSRHVTDEHELNVGHHLPLDGSITVDGQRFTANPQEADSETILLTHGLSQHAFYQSPARGYFSGDTHRARHWGTALNTGYLHKDNGYNGAYFIVDLADDEMDVSGHGLDESWKSFVCPDHEWYGRQFTPAKFDCGLCRFGTARQFSPIAAQVFDEVATSSGDDEARTATIDGLVAAAREYITDHDQFADQCRVYLDALATVDAPKPMNPLHPTHDPNTLTKN